MSYNSVVISSGHGKHVRGAAGPSPWGLDEVNEARRVVDRVAEMLAARGVSVKKFHDDTSKDQSTNLSTIVNFHNKQTREIDVSVHFNAYEPRTTAMGVEVLYVSQHTLASEMSSAIAASGFKNRGAKKRTDLYFLNKTSMPAILLEICFVDSTVDVEVYDAKFEAICDDIADVLGGAGATEGTDPSPPTEEVIAAFRATGKCSHFGGPDDTGVSPDEGLAFIYKIEDAPHLFLPMQPDGATGLARRLNPYINYVACRWDYDVTPKPSLLLDVALVTAKKTGVKLKAFPADWGPHQNTGRVADLSPGLMDSLGITTDDEVEVIFPYREG